MMILHSGAIVDVLELAAGRGWDRVQLTDIAYSLTLQQRWCGHARPGVTIAEHCLAMTRAARFQGASRATQLLALHHEDGEAFVGDMRSSIKHHPEMVWFRGLDQDLTYAAINHLATPAALEGSFGLVKRLDRQALVAEITTRLPQQDVPTWLEAEGFADVEPLDPAHYQDEQDGGMLNWMSWHTHLMASLT